MENGEGFQTFSQGNASVGIGMDEPNNYFIWIDCQGIFAEYPISERVYKMISEDYNDIQK